MKLINLLLLMLASAAAVAAEGEPRVSKGRKFVHPGIFYTEGDFGRMRAMVAAGREPWKKSFEALRASSYSNPGAWARPRGGKIEQGRFNATIGIDGRRAHDIALMWKLTGEDHYAAKARDFLVQNSNWTETSWNGTGPLDNGKIYLLVEAAELMRDYPGWAAADQKKFGDMLRNVFVPHIYSGDVMRWGNQGLTAWHGLLAIAIFLDDEKLYDRVWNYLTGRPHRPDDNPFPSGGVWKPDWPANYGEFFIERTKPPAFGNEPDWGYDDQVGYYIYPNGQCEESCRDQAHALYGLSQMVAIAEIFWNQGDDLYGHLDNRILRGLEWSLRYNLSDWEPTGFSEDPAQVTFENGLFLRTRTRNNRWTSVKPSFHARGADGGPAAPRTAALMHYTVRRGVSTNEVLWLQKAVDNHLANDGVGETWGTPPNWYYEFGGWGTLTKTRTRWMRGDPVAVPKVPATISATDYDRRPACRPTIEGGALSRIKRGDSFDYTVNVPETGDWRVSVEYRSVGRLELALAADGGRYKSVTLPASTEYRKHPLGSRRLEAGAVVVKIGVVNASAARIRAIVVEK